MKRFFVIPAMVSLVAVASLATAREPVPGDHPHGMHGPGMMHEPMREHMLERMTQKLKLTPQQQASIKGLFESARPNTEANRAAMRSNMEQLHKVQPGDGNYDQVVAAASQKAGELTTRMIADHAQLRAQVWQVLTPEQRKQLDEKMAGRMQHREQRRESRQQKRAKDRY